MIIELLRCQGCWRVVDQHTLEAGCKGCFSRLFRGARPTIVNRLKWFFTNPSHIIRLVILDLKGKDYESAV